MNINHWMGAGRLTAPPATRNIPTGHTVTEFRLAVDRKWKTQAGEEKKEVLFIDCAAWGSRGELIARSFGKGYHIVVWGPLKLEQWPDKMDPQKMCSKISVNVEGFEFVPGNPRNDQPQQPQGAPAQTPQQYAQHPQQQQQYAQGPPQHQQYPQQQQAPPGFAPRQPARQPAPQGFFQPPAPSFEDDIPF